MASQQDTPANKATLVEKVKDSQVVAAIEEFIKLESAGGILLLLAAIAALVIANSPLAGVYDGLLNAPVAVQIGELAIKKPLLLWINDGLMAVFFFLIGLEIKREFLEGELSSVSQVVLPGVGAIGGMVVPAGIYAWLNWGNATAMDGWAIPVATDIAFALGLLGVFGDRVPTPLKVFLLTLAIFDGREAWDAVAGGFRGAFEQSQRLNERTLVIVAAVGVIVANFAVARWLTRRWSFCAHRR